jgi:hypothetical protein
MSLLDKLTNRRIIIGIHGLANKPPKDLLEKWWKLSIREGLAAIGCKHTPFSFKLVYWADLLHESPEDPYVSDTKDRLYLGDPYVPGDPAMYKMFNPSKIKRKLLDKLERGIDTIFSQEKSFIDFDKFADLVIRSLFKDLDVYYHKECEALNFRGQRAREAIRKRLAEMLVKYRDREILLISHSMGTIISYDVLTQSTPDICIHTFITMGSPLGIPVIRKQIFMERGMDYRRDKQVPSPENIVHRWLNFSDIDDPVAINYNLADDFRKNSRGIGPEDTIVFNNYVINRKKDAHKLYGYLRTPEVAHAIHDFCTSGRPKFLDVLKRMFSGALRKKSTTPR